MYVTMHKMLECINKITLIYQEAHFDKFILICHTHKNVALRYANITQDLINTRKFTLFCSGENFRLFCHLFVLAKDVFHIFCPILMIA